jgi:hypothetical protein
MRKGTSKQGVDAMKQTSGARFGARLMRREFLALGLFAGSAYGHPDTKLSIVRLYDSRTQPVSRDVTKMVVAAVEETYHVTTTVCEPVLYEGRYEGNAILECLARRGALALAIANRPIEAAVRNGISTGLVNVAGWGDVPSEERERPRGSVITVANFNLRDHHAPDRLRVLAIHELGHNMGAWDCRDAACYMNSKIDLSSTVVPRVFCPSHREILWMYLR